MSYQFMIKFPGHSPVNLTVREEAAFDRTRTALALLGVNYVVRGDGWIGASFQMTPEDHDLLTRLTAKGQSPKLTIISQDEFAVGDIESRIGGSGLDAERIRDAESVRGGIGQKSQDFPPA